jgi:hypothetical protein
MKYSIQRIFCIMTWMAKPRVSPDDILRMKSDGNVHDLIRLLGHRDFRIQQQTAEALGTLGEIATLPLISALDSPNTSIRLGLVEALGYLGDSRAVKPLIHVLDFDQSIEVRWTAVLALGRIGSPSAIPVLVRKLSDRERYIRRVAAQTLGKIGWLPDSDTGRACYLIALQDWEGVRNLGTAASGPLSERVADNDPVTRTAIIPLLAHLGDQVPVEGLRECMKDGDPRIRWQAVSTAMNCGIPPVTLPRIVSRRQRTGPVPAGAAILNFFFFGLGYHYMGKWWGFPIFMTYMTTLVLMQLELGPFLPFLFVYPVTAIVAFQTYFMAKRISDF